MVIRLGNVPAGLLHEQELAQVSTIERLEAAMALIRPHEVRDAAIVAVREKSHPQHFFQRVGAVRCHQDTVPMRALAGSSQGPLRRGPAPPERQEYHRVILRAMGGHARMSREYEVQQRAAGTRQPANEDRHRQGNRLRLVGENRGFQPSQFEPEGAMAINQPAQQIQRGRDSESGIEIGS